MWDEFRSMTDSVSTGLVDNDQRLAPYIYDPMVRGVTYQAIIDKKKEAAGVYDKIVLENYGRSSVVNGLKSELEDSTSQTTGSILEGVLNIDPKNPTALTQANLDALDNLSLSINKCTYGSLPDGGCKQPYKKWNEFYGKGEGQHIITRIFNPNLSAHRATALSELSKGRVFSKKMNAAMRELGNENKRLEKDKDTPTLSKIRKLASIEGINLGKDNFMDATNKSWPQVKKALASNGKFQNLLGSNPPSDGANAKKDQGDSDKETTILNSTSEKVMAVGNGKNNAKVKAEEFSFKWNEDPNLSDNYHEQMEKDVEKIVQNGVMPADSGISKRKDQNIFNIISRRYIFSGWRRLGLRD